MSFSSFLFSVRLLLALDLQMGEERNQRMDAELQELRLVHRGERLLLGWGDAGGGAIGRLVGEIARALLRIVSEPVEQLRQAHPLRRDAGVMQRVLPLLLGA